MSVWDEKRYGGTPLHVAVCVNNLRAARQWVAAGGALDSVDFEGRTPLFVAATMNRTAMLRLLLAAGAKQHETALDGVCALHEAVFEGHDEVVRLLLEQQVRWPLVRPVDGCRLYCGHHGYHEAPLTVASRQLIYKNESEEVYQRIISLLLAAGAAPALMCEIPDDIGFFHAIEEDAGAADGVRQARRTAALLNCRVAGSEDALQKAALALTRRRMAEVAIALQSLRLPALITVLLFDEACAPPGACLRMHDTWRIATAVKHFHPAE